MDIETDYLIVGAGASGMAFADSLLAEADVDVVLVDRRERPGGHWRDAYPFVQLHTPSAYYGVTSTPLGQDRLIGSGRNQGFYEQAGADEICAYYDGVDGGARIGRASPVPRRSRPRGRRPGPRPEDRRRAHGLGAAAARGRDRAGVVHPRHPPAFLHRRRPRPPSGRSTICRRWSSSTSDSPSSVRERRASTPACGSSTRTSLPTGSAGSDPATCGSTTGPPCSRSTRWPRSCTASPSTRRPARRRRAWPTCSTGSSRPVACSGSTRRCRPRCSGPP